uniref:F-box domain-containing protein n=1 Tax=Caenorhabditis tropicalis TaxID=1561998 RepID=A0A1I7TSW4_9PELO
MPSFKFQLIVSPLLPLREFQLLQLPNVALREVMKNLNLKELFTLSLCSQKTKNIVKFNQNKSLKWEMCLSCMKSVLSIGNGRDKVNRIVVMNKPTGFQRYLRKTETVRIGRLNVSFMKSFGAVELIFHCDERTGFKALADYICDVFSTVPSVIQTYSGYLWMLEMYRNSLEFIYIYWTPIPLSHEEVLFTLTSCEAIELFILGCSIIFRKFLPIFSR